MEPFGDNLATKRRVPLAKNHMAQLRKIGEEREYAGGAIAVELGETLDRFIYVIDGEIEPVDVFSGKRLFGSSLSPTQFAGEIGFLSRSAVMTPMRATRPTRTLEGAHLDMLDMIARVPELSDHALSVFAARRRRQFEAGARSAAGREHPYETSAGASLQSATYVQAR